MKNTLKVLTLTTSLITLCNASTHQQLQDSIDSGMAESLVASNGVTIEAAPESAPNQGTLENTDTRTVNDRLNALDREVYGDLEVSRK